MPLFEYPSMWSELGQTSQNAMTSATSYSQLRTHTNSSRLMIRQKLLSSQSLRFHGSFPVKWKPCVYNFHKVQFPLAGVNHYNCLEIISSGPIWSSETPPRGGWRDRILNLHFHVVCSRGWLFYIFLFYYSEQNKPIVSSVQSQCTIFTDKWTGHMTLHVTAV